MFFVFSEFHQDVGCRLNKISYRTNPRGLQGKTNEEQEQSVVDVIKVIRKLSKGELACGSLLLTRTEQEIPSFHVL